MTDLMDNLDEDIRVKVRFRGEQRRSRGATAIAPGDLADRMLPGRN